MTPPNSKLSIEQTLVAELYLQIAKLRAENAKLKRVAEAVKGFKIHGSAKNGTHAGIMFDALAALESPDGE